MGRQWHFAMDESDEKLFMQYLKENGYVVVPLADSNGNFIHHTDIMAGHILILFMKRNGGKFLWQS